MPLSKPHEPEPVLLLLDQPPSSYRARLVKDGKVAEYWVDCVRDAHQLAMENKAELKQVPWNGKPK